MAKKATANVRKQQDPQSDQQAIVDARALLKRGDFPGAMERAGTIAKQSAHYDESQWLTVIAALQAGDHQRSLDAADFLVTKQPKAAPIHNLRGVALSALNRREEAQVAFETAHRLDPNNPEVAENLGVVLMENGFVAECHSFLKQVWALRKLNRKPALQLMTAALYMGDRELAREIASHFIAKGINDPDVNYAINRLYQSLGQIDKAQETLNAILTAHPDHADSLADKGILEMSGGGDEKARVFLERAIKSEPGHTAAQFLWAHMGGSGESSISEDTAAARERHLEQVHEALKSNALTYLERAELEFTAGKLLDSLKRHDECFDHYLKANALISARYQVDIDEHRKTFETLKNTFDDAFFRDTWSELAKRRKHTGRQLIYIIGMPRSGTTLTEQILASHPEVGAGGETTDVIRLGEILGGELRRDGTYVDFLGASTPAALDRVTSEYLKRVGEKFGAANRMTDKDLRNFIHLALAITLFPEAKIIHVQRNPIDTCVSCFFQYFKIYRYQYTNDLKKLGQYYRLYVDLMDHWLKVLPLDILSVSYEGLLADKEGVARAMLDHCGLPWDDACLDGQGADSVRTASVWQVRQPLYTQSKERWRRYEKSLDPLLDGLGDLAEWRPPLEPVLTRASDKT